LETDMQVRWFALFLMAFPLGGCALFWEAPGTPLGHAAQRGDLPAIRALIADGVDPNEFDATGWTPLHWAARGGHRLGPHHCLGEAAGWSDVVDTLIDGGADVNLTDRRAAIPGRSSGWTPLHVALHHEQFVTAARMLARGADPNIRSHQGTTVMAMAAQEGAPTQLLQEMLARGFDAQKAATPGR
jgi:ankyrin repeat protein